MNLLPKLKKNSQPATEASCAASAGIDLLGDLEPLANLVQPIRIHAAAHSKLLDALGKARFELRHQKNAPPPEMRLAIKREIVAATGDAESLARFDADNAAALKTEIESREQFLRNKDLLPARIAALESLVQESALKTTTDLPVTEIEDEAQKLFAPFALRLLAAAQVYAKARSEAMSVAHMLNRATAIRQYDIEGNYRILAEPELTQQVAQSDILPGTMTGVDWETLRKVNYRARSYDDALLDQLSTVLTEAGVRGPNLTVYRAKGDGDERLFYAPEPTGPVKRPEASPYSMPTRVVIDVA